MAYQAKQRSDPAKKVTSPKAATAASKTLLDPKANKVAKTAAGSTLAQKPSARKAASRTKAPQRGRPKMYENRVRVTVECESELAEWLAAEAKTWHLSRSQLLEKLAREFRERIENEDAEDAAEADAAIDAIERGEETVRPWDEFKRDMDARSE